MHSQNVILFLTLVSITTAQENHIIRDYFVYKNVKKVLGFSCGDPTISMKTIKMLNEEGIFAIMKTPQSKSESIEYFKIYQGTLGVFVDQRCPEYYSSDIFDETAMYRVYNYSYHWFVLGMNLDISMETLNDSAFSVTTDFVISIPNDQGFYDLYDVFNHCKYRGGTLNLTHYGSWDKNRGFTVNLLQPRISRRWNYHEMRLRAAGFINYRPKDIPLMRWYEEYTDSKNDVLSKYGYHIISTISDMFNFTMEVSELPPWFKNDTNGPLMRGLWQGEIDFGLYPSILTKQRLDLARVVGPGWPFRTCFMFRTTPTKDIKLTMLLQPLERKVWYLIVLFIVIFTILCSLIKKYEFPHHENKDYGVSILSAIGAFCQQGLFIPDHPASRIAFFNILVFGLMVYNYYSAAIVSARLNEPLFKMNDSLSTLVKSGFKMSSQEMFYFNFLLKNEDWEVKYFKKHWEDNVPDETKFIPVEDGVISIMKPGFAYHADPTYAYPYVDKYFDNEMICQLTEVHLYHLYDAQLWTSFNGQFEEIAKIGFLKLASTGIKSREVKRWASRKPYCHKDSLHIASVTIYESAAIFIFLITMMILSVIICVMENVVYHLINSKDENIIVPMPWIP